MNNKPRNERGSGEATAEPKRAAADAIDEALAAGSAPAAAADTRASAEDAEVLRQKAAERDEYLDLLQRVRADYANYQKRVQKEIDNGRRFAAQPLVLDLLPAIDNLERAIQTATSGDQAAGLLDGIRLVHQQLIAALARHGVRAIDAAGQPFDPDRHEAMLEQPSPDCPPRTVLQELQKGYRLHDRVIRPTRVVVSTAPDEAVTTAPPKPDSLDAGTDS